MDIYQQFIHLSRYARFDDRLGRRENWNETVGRYFDFFEEHLEEECNYHLPPEVRHSLERSVLRLETMPSMRCLMTAGEALRRENLAGFNCSYLPIDCKEAFSETLYILMCGTGVGYSVERQYVNKLPHIPAHLEKSDRTIVVGDSKEGWATALKELIDFLYAGKIPNIDYSKVRAAGERLKTFGGRASGPQPLRELFTFVIAKFTNAAGRQLNSLECHDIECKIGECVVVGGVRRSAMISLTNLSDDRMRHAKFGDFGSTEKQRYLANISSAYTERPEVGAFMKEWTSIYESHSGERGIFNRVAAQRRVEMLGNRDANHEFGTNPCGEIILRPNGLCNLSEIVVRHDDDYETLREKVRVATILGTFQSTLTNYNFVRDVWIRNSVEERLLGVSQTGVLEHRWFQSNNETGAEVLRSLREYAREVNEEWAQRLDINPSAAITTNKPSGTVSQLVDAPSGLHTGHAPYYVRTVRADSKDPMTQFLKDSGVTWEPCVANPDSVAIFSFPKKCEGMTRHDLTAIQHLEIVNMFAQNWTDHNTSCTISVREEEWPEVGAWVWKNFDDLVGLTFLPMSDHVYAQAPYQDCTEDEYHELLERTPQVLDWRLLADIESGRDNVNNTKDLACSAGVCEVVDILKIPAE